MGKDSIKGFPEWLPEQRMVELRFLDTIRRHFELAGFAPIETRSVEPLDVLMAKGETDKEIYVLRRLHATDKDEDASLGLHFDLTVPFARYVSQNRGQLVFPMRRYQMQKAWRGERPQEGRYREFYQCDADVIAENELGVHYDVEMTVLLAETVAALPVPPVTVRVNNRKILEGFYRSLGAQDFGPVLRVVDKLAKIGADAVREQLIALGLSSAAADQCLKLAHVKGDDRGVVDAVRALGEKHEVLEQGLDELSILLDATRSLPRGAVVADLGIARGLDYYTGIIFEGLMQGHEEGGSVCSGGRYDNLASMGSKQKLPGIGASIGLSRILGRLFKRNQLIASRKTPSCVLVMLDSDETRVAAFAAARALRARGIAAEVHDRALKYGKQMEYAQKKGIPFVWFPVTAERTQAELKDIRVGVQSSVDIATWNPPPEDLTVQVSRGP